MFVPLYLKSKSVPLCTMVKLAATKFAAFVAFVAEVADVALVAEVAVAALPLMLIPHVPLAPEPLREGTSSAVCAAPAVLDPVPPLTTATVPVSLEAASDAMKDGSE
jgi:hypothetical protein